MVQGVFTCSVDNTCDVCIVRIIHLTDNANVTIVAISLVHNITLPWEGPCVSR